MIVFSDTELTREAETLLRGGLAPHELLVAQEPATSVLSQPAPDPRFADAEVAFGQPFVSAIAKARNLRWVHLTSAGYTRYDTPEFRSLAAQRGLILTNSSQVYAAACAEHALAFMLAQSRRLPLALATSAANGTPEWLHLRGTSTTLRGQRLLILGFGAIGSCLVKLLAPFEMEITALRRNPTGDELVKTCTIEDLSAVLPQVDHVVSILPENAATLRFINTARLAEMKRGAVFYNIGRGTTVDQEALADALHAERLAAAWLDVTDPEPLPAGHPLLLAPNCYITPHTAGGQWRESEALVRHFLENFRRFCVGSPLLDRIL